uniref:Uncharacterized protein n=1 Tax=Paramoeba aestuarina TaxID=180227 RepID=A0A7S4U8G5_9EUKA
MPLPSVEGHGLRLPDGFDNWTREHDRLIMVGVYRHGLGNYSCFSSDEELMKLLPGEKIDLQTSQIGSLDWRVRKLVLRYEEQITGENYSEITPSLYKSLGEKEGGEDEEEKDKAPLTDMERRTLFQALFSHGLQWDYKKSKFNFLDLQQIAKLKHKSSKIIYHFCSEIIQKSKELLATEAGKEKERDEERDEEQDGLTDSFLSAESGKSLLERLDLLKNLRRALLHFSPEQLLEKLTRLYDVNGKNGKEQEKEAKEDKEEEQKEEQKE